MTQTCSGLTTLRIRLIFWFHRLNRLHRRDGFRGWANAGPSGPFAFIVHTSSLHPLMTVGIEGDLPTRKYFLESTVAPEDHLVTLI